MSAPDPPPDLADDAGRNEDRNEDRDEDRDEEPRGATTQARMFAGLTVFAVVAASGYGLLSHEPAGTTLLLLTGGLTGLCGLYISWNRPTASTAHDAHREAIEQEPWFPHASPWPLAIAVSVVLAANAMLLGLWLLLPAAVLLAASIAGFAAQSRHRS